MNKTELIAEVANKAGLSRKDAEKALGAVVETITEAVVKGDKVQLVGFGSFETKQREARTGRNPKTKETIEIPATLSQNNSSDISQRFYRTLKMRGCSALAGRPLLLLQMTIKNGYFSEKSLEFDGGLWHNYLKLLHGKG